MIHPVAHKWIRRSAGLAAVSAVFASYAAVSAFRQISARPGEAALRLVPANALCAGTLDLSPSPSQALAFKRIDDALGRNDLAGITEKSLFSLFSQGAKNPAQVEALGKLVTRNGAFALIPGTQGKLQNQDLVVMLAVTDGREAERLLEKGTPLFYKGVKYYSLDGSHDGYLVFDDLLIMGRPTSLYAIKQVHDGTATALAANAAYRAARAHVADDANLMVFISPELIKQGDREMPQFTSDWMSAGLAIRDGGIGLSTSANADVASNPEIANMEKIAPLRQDLLKVLPAGAYGVVAISQPSGYFDSVKPTLERGKGFHKAMADMEDGLAKSTGLEFDRDIRPAFRGDAVIAAYPNEGAGADLLAVMDDANGANPADAVERFQDFVRLQMEKEGNQQGPLWSDHTTNGAHFYRLGQSQEAELRKSFGNGMDPNSINKAALVNNKTIAWATVGKAVIGSSSQELLDRAVAAYSAQSAGLDSDSKFGLDGHEALDGSQTLAIFSLSRIAEGVKNTVYTEKMNPDGKQMFGQILDAFASVDRPLTIHGSVQPDGRLAGGAFVPLDYDKMIDIVGNAMKKSKPHA